MKKTMYMFLLSSALMACNGYASKTKTTSKEAETEFEINKEVSKVKLPIAFGNVGEITELQVTGKVCRFVMEINKGYEQLYMNLSEKDLKKIMLLQASSMATKLKPFLDENIGLTYVFRLKSDPSKEISVYLSADEIKNELQNPASVSASTPLVALQTRTEAINKTLPKQLDEYTVLDTCYITDKAFVYAYTLKESDDFTLDNNDVFTKLLTQVNKQQLRTEGLAVLSFLNNLQLAKRELHYDYTGSSTGLKINIVLSESDIDELIKLIHSDAVNK